MQFPGPQNVEIMGVFGYESFGEKIGFWDELEVSQLLKVNWSVWLWEVWKIALG